MLTHNHLNWGLLMVGELTAAATIGLAMATFWMAKKTRDLAVQGERHHQDGAMPICLLEELAGNRGNTVEFVEDNNGGQPVFKYRVYGPLRNIGQGPALNLRLVLRFPTFNNHEVIYDLDSLGAGQARGTEPATTTAWDPECVMAAFSGKLLAAHAGRRIAVIPVSPTAGFNETTVRMSDGAWGTIFLEYSDVFGNHYCTQHNKDPRHKWMQFLGKEPRPAPIAAPAIPSGNKSAFQTSRLE